MIDLSMMDLSEIECTRVKQSGELWAMVAGQSAISHITAGQSAPSSLLKFQHSTFSWSF